MTVDWGLPVSVGGVFVVGVLIGYALKKVIKLVAVVVGLFFAGLAYLQYQQMVNINWNKIKPHLRIPCQHLPMLQHKFLVLTMVIIQQLYQILGFH
jgi:uncharacterized membrane protein (Fun14 family)